jgi:hypothetical protein
MATDHPSHDASHAPGSHVEGEGPRRGAAGNSDGPGRQLHLWTHPFVLAVLFLFLVLVILTGFNAWSAYRMATRSYVGPAPALMALRIMQVTLGLFTGLVLIPIGVVLAWFGIRGDIDASVDGSELKAKVITTSPGVLLFICGTAIIYAAISAKIEVSDDRFRGYGAPPIERVEPREKMPKD